MILGLDSAISLEDGGGKAANLARLTRAGLPVPPGFVIPTAAYREYLSINGLDGWPADTARAASVDDPGALEAASAAIRARFAAGVIPARWAEAIRAAYAALGRPAVAVRSSATTEDLPDLSFAGQQDTFLNVVGDAALLHAVVQCWSSLWTARAIGYRARNGILHDEAALAAVVQEMVRSDTSGVLFTANPVTGKRSETVIEATFGLGEALVSGRVEPDRYVVDAAAGRVLERRLGAKALSVRPRTEGGTVEVRENGTRSATLTESDVLELVGLGRRVADLFHGPQDIEWAQTDGRFHLLQARAITTLYPLPEGIPNDGLHVLVSASAIQGMLDPITPLGADVFRVALPKALAALGGPVRHARPSVIAGERWFLDLTYLLSRRRVRSIVRNALRVIEPTTGEALDEVLADPAWVPLQSRSWLRDLPVRFIAVIGRALGNLTYDLLWPDRGRERTQRRLAAAVNGFRERSAAARSLGERIMLLQDAFDWLLRSGLPLLMPAVATGLGSLRVLHLLATEVPDGEPRVLELTRGLPHNVTTEMDLALWQVARTIRAGSGDNAFFGAEPRGLARAYLAGQLPPTIQAAIHGFLRKYGMRGVGEIDLGLPRWRDDPTGLIQVLQTYLRIDDDERAPDAVFRRGAETATRVLASLLADVRRTRFGWLKAFVMRRAARRMRALAGLRESPKFTVISMFDAVRSGLLASGEALARSRVLDSPEDIFFLHINELQSIAAGETGAWRATVRDRRRLYAREQRRRHIPRVLLSDGRAFFGRSGDHTDGDASATLVGTPVSPGVASGLVHVVFDPAAVQLIPGEILVCRGTDPAWTPLFLAAGGLVTEVGGLVTHGAVVAREYGIPAVVGVRDATTRLRTGDRVRLDGTSGSVVILTE